MVYKNKYILEKNTLQMEVLSIDNSKKVGIYCV